MARTLSSTESTLASLLSPSPMAAHPKKLKAGAVTRGVLKRVAHPRHLWNAIKLQRARKRDRAANKKVRADARRRVRDGRVDRPVPAPRVHARRADARRVADRARPREVPGRRDRARE